MYVLTIICSTCNQPETCEAHVCETMFPRIHEHMSEKGHLLISGKVYVNKKAEIDTLIRSCPTGSIVLTGPKNE